MSRQGMVVGEVERKGCEKMMARRGERREERRREERGREERRGERAMKEKEEKMIMFMRNKRCIV